MAYYVLVDDEQTGPFEDAAIADMVARGEVTADTLVWAAGMADWAPARGVAGLASLFGAAPPPAAGFARRPAAPVPAAAGPVERLDIAAAIATGLGAFSRQPGRAMLAALVYNIVPIVLVAPVFGVLFALYGGEPEAGEANPGMMVLIALLVVAMLAVVVILYGGFCACMIDLVRDRQVEVAKVFSGFSRAGPLIAFGILYALAVAVGFMVLIAPGVFVAVAFMLTPYIVIESELSGIAAMKASFRAIMTLGWWRCFALLVLLFAALVVASLVLEGLGLVLGDLVHALLQFAFNIALTAVAGAIFAAIYEQARRNSERAEA